jgi:hypothetical protein
MSWKVLVGRGEGGQRSGASRADPAKITAGHAASTAEFVFRLGLQPLALVHVVVLAFDQLPAAHVLPAPDAYDNRFHTTNLNGMNQSSA